MSDESSSYYGLDKEFKAHKSVSYSKKQYVRGEVHANTIGGFWALMKRGINGIYHHISREHMHRYTDEYAYRYNTRKSTDPQRFEDFFDLVECRLTYAQLVPENKEKRHE